MKKNIFIFLFIVITTVIAIVAFRHNPYPYEIVDGDPYQTRIYKLKNGLTVYLSQNNEKPEIQSMVAVRAGAEDDPLESTGLAHYQEHLMFKGTTQIGTMDYNKEKNYLNTIDSLYEVYGRTVDSAERKQIYHLIDSFSYEDSKYIIANEYDKLMSSIGATKVNAFTSSDKTCYICIIPSNEIERWAIIEAERMQNEVVRAFHTELETVYEEYNMYSTDDSWIVHNAINNILYANLPYRQHTVLGTAEDLKNPSLKNIKKFYNTFYRPNNTAICLSGDLDYDKTITIIDRYFGKWENGEIPQRMVYPDYNLTEAKDTIVYGQEADNLWLAWKMPGIGNDDVDILKMMQRILQNGKCGLFDVDLIQAQKVLSAYSVPWFANDFTTFFVIGEPKKNQSENELKNLLLNELEKLKKGEFDENILKAVINNYRKSEMSSMQSNYQRVTLFMNSFINKLPYNHYVQEIDRLSKVTKDDIVRIANTYFTDKYVCVHKRKVDKMNAKPIEKPKITPILMNRDSQSIFAKKIMKSKVQPIEAQFVNFDTDMEKVTLNKGQDLLYVQNKDNDIFDIRFIINVGRNEYPYMSLIPSFMYYLGTDSLSVEEFKKQLYILATDVKISAGLDEIRIGMNGLQTNFSESLRLLEKWVLTALPEENKYKEMVKDIIKSHEDAKTSQTDCFSRLMNAGMMGLQFMQQHTLTPYMMNNANGKLLLNQLRNLIPQISTVTYYGPADKETVATDLNNSSDFIAQGNAASRQKASESQYEVITEPQVWIVPFKAPNIYLVGYANRGVIYNPKQEAVTQLFNAYFSGGMDGIVFQEMRESRALAYSSSANYSLAAKQNHYNIFYTYIVSQNDKLVDCIQNFDSICNNMPLSQQTFDKTKTALLKKIEKRRVSRSSIIGTYLAYQERGWKDDYNKTIYEEIKKLTLDDIVKFQQENVKNNTYRYLILGDEAKLNMDFIKSLGKVKKLTLTDIFVY